MDFPGPATIEKAKSYYNIADYYQAALEALIVHSETDEPAIEKEAFRIWHDSITKAEPAEIVRHLDRILKLFDHHTVFWREAQMLKLKNIYRNPRAPEFN